MVAITGKSTSQQQQQSKARSSVFYIGMTLLVVAQGFWMMELTQQIFNTNGNINTDNNNMPITTLSYSEFDFIPKECHKYLVQDFPTLSNLLTLGKDSNMGSSGGEWSACTHIEKYGVNFAAFFARHLAFGLQPKSVLEFGCGLGTTSDYLARFVPNGGSKVVCIEPEPMLGEVLNVRQFPHRPLQLSMLSFAPEAQSCANALYSHSSSSSSSRNSKSSMQFDLVLSLEVAEHVPPEFQSQLIQRLAAATSKYLVFSAARPDQKGTGHLDESSKSRTWWIEHFEKEGLVYLPQLSRALRRVTATPERAYDLGKNLIAMGRVPAGVDIEEIPELAHDCLFYPKFNLNFRKMNGTMAKQYDDKEEQEYIAKHPEKQMPPYLTLEQPCPFPTDEQMEKRQLWVEGQTQALWPELDLLIRQVKSGQLKCSTTS
mmetsp:Transcript_27370/g.40412  ORF Transcript_27370/g.40412 Transcript_27370/m.40412 type:complete len:429 (-) Transcript_27370:16-1302(-)